MAFPDYADKKKCQTLINVAAEAAQQMKDAATKLLVCRTVFQAATPDTTGTLLEGSLAAVNTWITDVNNLANTAVADQLVAARHPGHVNEY
jgi:adenylosuccinate lyase